jgi:hypothetical protein
MLAIPAAISAVQGIIGSRSAKKAGKQISAAATKQAGETRATGEKVVGRMGEMYEKGVGEYQPYADVGEQGLKSLSDFLGLGGAPSAAAQPFKFDAAKAAVDPSLQFRIDQGNQAIMRNRLSKGLASGGTLKALDQYSQGLASEEYQNMFNRGLAEYNTNQDVYSRLMGVTGLGYGAAGNIAGLGTNFANTAGGMDMSIQEALNNLLMQGAGAQASGTMGSGNAWSNALGNIGNSIQSYSQMKQLSDLLGMQGGGVPQAPNQRAMVPSDLFANINPGFTNPR